MANITRAQALRLANHAAGASNQDIKEIINFCESIADIKGHFSSNAGAAARFLPFLYSVINGGEILPRYGIFQAKNSKVPFIQYSTLPLVNCPGAAECKTYCYSLKAWRYPNALFRQIQNTILERRAFSVITSELLNKINAGKYKKLNKIDFRLYVDGDFPSYEILDNWLNFLAVNPRLNVYGYSKSLHLFKQRIESGDIWPKNYVLNLSNGGKYDNLHNELIKHDQVRGKFYAVSIGRKTSPQKLTKPERAQIRKQTPRKVFICPGLCGSCTSAGHACGNLSTFKNLDIVIPIH